MYKVVRKADTVIRKISENKIAINYITKEISQGVSLAITEAKDYHEHETARYNRIYFVLEGTLILKFNNQEVALAEGDSCYLEKATPYEMFGSFRVLVVNQPAFGT